MADGKVSFTAGAKAWLIHEALDALRRADEYAEAYENGRNPYADAGPRWRAAVRTAIQRLALLAVEGLVADGARRRDDLPGDAGAAELAGGIGDARPPVLRCIDGHGDHTDLCGALCRHCPTVR